MSVLNLVVDVSFGGTHEKESVLSLVLYNRGFGKTHFIRYYDFYGYDVKEMVSIIKDKCEMFGVSNVLINTLGIGIALKDELEYNNVDNVIGVAPNKSILSELALKFRNEYFLNKVVVDEAFGKDINYLANIDCKLSQGFLSPTFKTDDEKTLHNNIILCFYKG